MLKKILISLTVVVVSFVTGYAAAQSYFLQKKTTAPTDAAPQTPSVLSPSDFKSRSQEIQQQKNQALDKQIKDSLSAVPPTPPPSTPKVTPLPTADTASTPEAAAGTPPPPSSGSTPSAATPSPATSAESSSSGPQPAAPSPPPPAQSEVYTGFQNQGTSGGNSPKPPPPASSGSGWNIKY